MKTDVAAKHNFKPSSPDLHLAVTIDIAPAGIAAATLTYGDAILSPHLEAIGFGTAAIGWTFAVNAAVYAVFSPLAG